MFDANRGPSKVREGRWGIHRPSGACLMREGDVVGVEDVVGVLGPSALRLGADVACEGAGDGLGGCGGRGGGLGAVGAHVGR